MEDKIMKIGRVTLDFTDYPGEDFYSEGAEEDALLEIVKNHPAEEFNRIIAREKRWSVLYHLSHLRGNIVDFLPVEKSHRVLEIGAGCGAVTGTLAEMAGKVTCVELSRKRSMINAWRNRDFGNIEIRVGNFQQIEKGLTETYDYIFLIGVLEYALSYIEAEDPYGTLLRILERHLSPGGRIVIAIENKYGMKYFAGCREDHTGRYYDGIEGYRKGGGARTFSAKGLRKLIEKAGYRAEFYYPYPDYKLPTTVYSDEKLPSRGDLKENLRNFDGERLVSFDEEAAFDEAVRDGYFPFFSNSFLTVLTRDRETGTKDCRKPIYSKHSNERDPAFRIRTDIVEDPEQGRLAAKYPLGKEAVPHLERMEKARWKLESIFAGTGFIPNACRRVKGEDGNLSCLEFEYLTGRSMGESLDLLLEEGRKEEWLSSVLRFAEVLRGAADAEFRVTPEFSSVFSVTEVPGNHRSMACTDLDLIFSNLIDHGGWNIIDYEWTFDFPIPVDFVIYRAVFYHLSGPEGLPSEGEELFQKLGIPEETLSVFADMERSFQSYISGRNLSLDTMYALFGGNAVCLQNTLALSRKLSRPEHPMIYYDRGEGYHEEDARLLIAKRDSEDRITVDTEIPENCSAARFDPVESSCLIRIEEISLDGVPLSSIRTNGKGMGDQVVLFDSADPQLHLGAVTPGALLRLKYRIASLDPDFLLPIAREYEAYHAVPESRWERLFYKGRPASDVVTLSGKEEGQS